MPTTRRLLRHAAAASTLALLVTSSARVAHADDSSTLAAATVLFDEGVKLMEAGRAEEACPKFARSNTLSPNGGTLQALAECYEKTGRIATAWVTFREVAARAASAGKHAAEASAVERARRLEPQLPRLTITVPTTSTTSGLEVRRDGTVVTNAELGVPVPADPGPHEISATAPHRKPFRKTVTMRPRETLDFAIPALAPETVEDLNGSGATSAPPSEQAPPTGNTQRGVGIAVAGVGVASIIVGGVFGVLAKAKNDEALEPQNCPTSTQCTAAGISLTDDAKSKALVSTILIAVGAAGIVGGGILFLTAPRPSSSGATTTARRAAFRLAPTWSPGSIGGAADLTW